MSLNIGIFIFLKERPSLISLILNSKIGKIQLEALTLWLLWIQILDNLSIGELIVFCAIVENKVRSEGGAWEWINFNICIQNAID